MPRSAHPAPRGLIFDFDGLIIDTEWPEYVSWKEAFGDHGLDLDLLEWVQVVGRPGAIDFHRVLEERLGRAVDREGLDARRVQRHREISEGLAVLPGVRELMLEGAAKGWRIGVASNSSREWVYRNLRRHGLDAWIETLRTRDNVPEPKPAPDAYLLACRDLGVRPEASLAFEDSAPGVEAARAAGMRVVAVPNRLTRHHDLGSAHLVVADLASFSLPA